MYLQIKMHMWYILMGKNVIILSFWKRGVEGSSRLENVAVLTNLF